MKISEFRVGAARTINLGNFESLRIEAAITVSVDTSTDDLPTLRKQAQAELRAVLEDTYRAQHKKAQEVAQ